MTKLSHVLHVQSDTIVHLTLTIRLDVPRVLAQLELEHIDAFLV